MEPENAEWQGVSEHTGFPNAATDKSLSSLDLTKLLVTHPSSTFFMRVAGNANEEQGIFDGDIVVIDRALVPRKTDQVIWWQDESFAIGLAIKVPRGSSIWGVVTYVVHAYRSTHAS